MGPGKGRAEPLPRFSTWFSSRNSNIVEASEKGKGALRCSMLYSDCTWSARTVSAQDSGSFTPGCISPIFSTYSLPGLFCTLRIQHWKRTKHLPSWSRHSGVRCRSRHPHVDIISLSVLGTVFLQLEATLFKNNLKFLTEHSEQNRDFQLN